MCVDMWMDLVKQLLLDEKYRYLAMEESWLAYLGYHGGGGQELYAIC